jgi:uncharacterized protein with HEPN domain
MTKTPDVFLRHILQSIDLIEKRMKNITQEQFMNDIDLQDMTIRRLEIIGEAIRNLPKDFRNQHAHINWQDPAGMRSALIHAYFNVDLDVVWDTVKNDLSPFKKQIQELLVESEK